MVSAILVGCSPEALELVQAPEPQSAAEPETPPVNTIPQPKETEAEVVTPPKSPRVGVTDPIEVTPAPTPPEIKTKGTNPAKDKISPAEIVARKLISDNPMENLEVLNQALQIWLTTKGKLPEKIGDLVTEQLLPMLPMAPQGKIFQIDREAKRVVLVVE